MFEVLPEGNGLRMIEIAEGETVDAVRACTGADFSVDLDSLVPMRQ